MLQIKGVSTYQVAKATGISQMVFSRWKSGKSTPKVDKLMILADYFGVDVNYFLTKRGETEWKLQQ